MITDCVCCFRCSRQHQPSSPRRVVRPKRPRMHVSAQTCSSGCLEAGRQTLLPAAQQVSIQLLLVAVFVLEREIVNAFPAPGPVRRHHQADGAALPARSALNHRLTLALVLLFARPGFDVMQGHDDDAVRQLRPARSTQQWRAQSCEAGLVGLGGCLGRDLRESTPLPGQDLCSTRGLGVMGLGCGEGPGQLLLQLSQLSLRPTIGCANPRRLLANHLTRPAPFQRLQQAAPIPPGIGVWSSPLSLVGIPCAVWARARRRTPKCTAAVADGDCSAPFCCAAPGPRQNAANVTKCVQVQSWQPLGSFSVQ